MACPRVGPCEPFVEALDLCCLTTGQTFPDPCVLNGEPVPPQIIENAIQAASEILWAATARQFGKCTVTIRPCHKKCGPCPENEGIDFFNVAEFGYGFGGSYPWIPALLPDGSYTNISTFCGCGDCCNVCEIPLPYPVCSVDEVKVNGVTLGPESYRVDDFRTLVRLGALPMIVDDWSSLPLNTPSPIQQGDLILSGSVSTQLFFPLLSETKVRVTGAGVVQWVLGNQANDEPGSPCIQIQFDNPGDTATVANPALVLDVSGPATYNSVTGVITYTGQASPPRVGPELVKICYLQSLKVDTITFDQAAWIYAFTWTDLHPDTDVGCWPDCQNLSLPDTEPDTFSVTVTYGREVPALVKLATAELACELIKACSDQPCRLPQRVQSISRQGVTVGFLDPMNFLAQGSTGIYIVELARQTFNPANLPRRAGVSSPDYNPKWRRTGT